MLVSIKKISTSISIDTINIWIDLPSFTKYLIHPFIHILFFLSKWFPSSIHTLINIGKYIRSILGKQIGFIIRVEQTEIEPPTFLSVDDLLYLTVPRQNKGKENQSAAFTSRQKSHSSIRQKSDLPLDMSTAVPQSFHTITKQSTFDLSSSLNHGFYPAVYQR